MWTETDANSLPVHTLSGRCVRWTAGIRPPGRATQILNSSGGRSGPPSALPDDAGLSLILRGFNTASSAKSAPDGMPKFTEADLEREHADMGTNFVRFLISWRSVEPEPGQYDQEYLDRVEDRVSWYAERGYKVMLDMHQD